MPDSPQNFTNHVRWQPLYHFVLSPILLIHLIWSIVRLIKAPSADHAEQLLLALGLLIMMLLVRVNPLKAQDRLIRLEEQLRYQRLLPAELANQAAALPVRFIVALRFASDEELPALIREVLAGKFAKPTEVKRAIKNWRGDYFRV